MEISLDVNSADVAGGCTANKQFFVFANELRMNLNLIS